MKLDENFYSQSDTLNIAKQLIGCVWTTRLGGKTTQVKIVETEAYLGITDKASHSANGRLTARTAVMYKSGGLAYVYLIYGIHCLFNIVTNAKDIPHAILIRAGEPTTGIETMAKRRGTNPQNRGLTKGPGNVAKAMGIELSHSGISLCGNQVWIEKGDSIPAAEIIATKRIGVDYAGEDALLPYRFILKNNIYVSGSSKQNEAAIKT